MADYTVRFLGDDSQLSGTLKNIKGELNSTGLASSKLDLIQLRFNKIINSSAPLKKQLRDLTAIMAKMNLDNMTDNDVFVTMTAKAAEMKDALGDASQAIRLMSSDTAKLDATIEGFQVLAGAAGVVTGIMGTLGTENERLLQAMLKVLSVISVMNGVQLIANALNKDSILMLRLKLLWQTANNAATIKSTAETVKNTAATTANTVAGVANNTATKIGATVQNAWNVTKAIAKALVGDFTGLLIVGAGALLTYALATGDSTEETDKQAEATKRAKEATDEFAKAVADGSSKQIAQIETLTTQYSNLHTEVERNDFINKHRKEIENLVGATDDLRGSWDKFVKNKDKIVEALTEIAIANAYLALIEKVVSEYIEKRYKMTSGKVPKKKWELGDVVSEDKVKEIGLVEGVDYRKGGMNWRGEKLNLLEAPGVARANSFEIAKSRKGFQDSLNALDKGVLARVSELVNEMDKHKNKGNSLYPKIPSNNNTTTGGGGRTYPTNKNKTNTIDTANDTLKNAIVEASNKVKFLLLLLDNNIISQELYNSEYLKVLKNLLGAYEKNAQATGKISEGYKKQLDTVNKLIQEEEKNKYTNLDENFSAEYTKLALDRNKGLISETEYLNKLLDLYETYASALKDYVDKFPEAKKALETIVKESNKIKVSDKINEITKPYTKSVSLADRYKTPTQKELRQNKIDTNISRHDELSGQISQLKELQNLVGKNTEAWLQYAEAIKGIESELSKIVNETDSLVNDSKYEDLIDLVKKYKKELISVSYSSLKSGLSDINNIYSSFADLSDNLDRANNGFEKFMVIMNSAFSVIDSVVGIINGVSSVISIILGITGANNALSVSSAATAGALGALTASIVALEAAGATKMASDVAQIATTKALTAALLELAAAGFFAAHAYIPFAGFGIGAGFASSAAALVKSLGAATLLADGGIIEGSSYHGDRIVARLNAGEMVLNRKLQANLFRALDNGISSNAGGGKVEFEIKGSTLKGVLKNYDNKMNKVR